MKDTDVVIGIDGQPLTSAMGTPITAAQFDNDPVRPDWAERMLKKYGFVVKKMNPNHDERGRFTYGAGASSETAEHALFSDNLRYIRDASPEALAQMKKIQAQYAKEKEQENKQLLADAVANESNSPDYADYSITHEQRYPIPEIASDEMWDAMGEYDREVIEQYTSSGYSSINVVVSGDTDNPNYDYYLQHPSTEPQIKTLRAAFENDKAVAPENMLVYRSVNVAHNGLLPYPEGYHRNENPFAENAYTREEMNKLIGKDFVDKAFASTSLYKRVASGFSAGYRGRVQAVIEVPKGSKALLLLKHSTHDEETEVLLPDHSIFHVKGIRWDMYGKPIMVLRYMGPQKTKVLKYDPAQARDEKGRWVDMGMQGKRPEPGEGFMGPLGTGAQIGADGYKDYHENGPDDWMRAASDTQWSKLTAQQKMSMSGYTATWYRSINKHVSGASITQDPTILQAVEDLRTVIKSSPAPENMIVYRTANMGKNDVIDVDNEPSPLWDNGAPDSLLRGLVGKDFTDKVFGSTSLNKDVAWSFNHGEKARLPLRIRVPKGSPIFPVLQHSVSAGEHEMLLPDHARFHITGFGYDESTQRKYLMVDYVP